MEIEATRTSSQKRKCHKKMKPKTIKTDMYPVYDNIDAATYMLPVTIIPTSTIIIGSKKTLYK